MIKRTVAVQHRPTIRNRTGSTPRRNCWARRIVLAIAAVTAVLTGCSGGAEGSAVAAEPDPWDPCSVPDEAIDAIGLDTTTKSTWGDGLNVPNWLLCYWKGTEDGTRYYFNIRSSPVNTTDEIVGDPAYTEVARPILDGRYRGYQYQEKSTDAPPECNIAVDTAAGVVNFDVAVLGEIATTFETCELVLTHASALVNYLPPPTS